MVDKTSKIILVVTLILLVLTVSATYYKYFVLNDIETYYDDYGEEETEDIG